MQGPRTVAEERTSILFQTQQRGQHGLVTRRSSRLLTTIMLLNLSILFPQLVQNIRFTVAASFFSMCCETVASWQRVAVNTTRPVPNCLDQNFIFYRLCSSRCSLHALTRYQIAQATCQNTLAVVQQSSLESLEPLPHDPTQPSSQLRLEKRRARSKQL